MRLSTKRRTTSDDVRRVALAALATALDDRKEEAKKKPGLTGMRAVATGAVIYTAGKAAFGSRRFIREHLGSNTREEDEEYEEPEAEEDEEYEEPRAEEDEEYEEPGAEEDEENEDGEAARRSGRARSGRPPSHPKRTPGKTPEIDLPSRPSRSRAPVRT